MKSIMYVIIGFFLIIGTLGYMAVREVFWGFQHVSDAIVDTFSGDTHAADARAIQEANRAKEDGREVAVLVNEANMRQQASNGYAPKEEDPPRKPTVFDNYANAFSRKNYELIGDRFSNGGVFRGSPARYLVKNPDIECWKNYSSDQVSFVYVGIISHNSARYVFKSTDGVNWNFCEIKDAYGYTVDKAYENDLNALLSIAKEAITSMGN